MRSESSTPNSPSNKQRKGRGSFKSDWRGSDKGIQSASAAQSSSASVETNTKPLAWRSRTVEAFKGNSSAKEASSDSQNKVSKETPKGNDTKSSESGINSLESSLSKLALGHQDTKSTPEIRKNHRKTPKDSQLDKERVSHSTLLRSSQSKESVKLRTLELYDFSSTTFNTGEIHSLFKDTIRNDAYRIKWEENRSKVYLIFKESSIGESLVLLSTFSRRNKDLKLRGIAKRALDTYSASCSECKMKFFDGPESLLMEDWERPSPSGRPVTTDVVARRLLAGALGIRLPKRDPEREKAEAMKLKLAKEQRDRERLEATKKDQEIKHAWET